MKDDYSNIYGKDSKRAARRISYHTRLFELKQILGKDELILDIGCASGDYSIELINSGISSICCDINLDSIQSLHKKNQQMPTILADGSLLPFRDNLFSAIIAMNCLRYFQKPDKAISEFRRVLKPHGRIIIFEHNRLSPDSLLFKKDVVHFFKPQEMARLTKMKGFKDQRIKMILLSPSILSFRIATSIVNMGNILNKSMINKIYPEFILIATKNE